MAAADSVSARRTLTELSVHLERYLATGGDLATVAQLAELARRAADLVAGEQDHLTGLATRDEAIRRLQRWSIDGESATVICINIDRFKAINDSYGRSTGDEILRQVAGRLTDVTRADDVVTRTAGDEFLVLARAEDPDVELAVDIANRISDSLSFTAVVGRLRVPITASAGCAVHYVGESADDVITNADVAMRLAKSQGGDQLVRFDTEMRVRLISELTLEREIRFGIEHDEFVVNFQPVVDLRTGELRGAEALVRWNHPTRGRLEPGDFIESAELAGLAGRLDSYVLRCAVRRLSDWRSAGLISDEFRLGVNVSGSRFGESQMVDEVIGELSAAGVTAQQLVLEITETSMMRDIERSLTTMKQLTGVGLRLSVDDFGTGWSSLAYLKQFPVDSLKIDQSFVAGLGVNADDDAIVRATIDLAGALGLRVVAEGVERTEQAAALLALGCGSAQGYLYSRPLEADVFVEQWLRRR